MKHCNNQILVERQNSKRVEENLNSKLNTEYSLSANVCDFSPSSYRLLVGCLILACRLVHTHLSVAARSALKVLPMSSVIFRSYCIFKCSFCNSYSLNLYFGSLKEIPQLLPRSPPILKTKFKISTAEKQIIY
jgi:hypothetical protein